MIEIPENIKNQFMVRIADVIGQLKSYSNVNNFGKFYTGNRAYKSENPAKKAGPHN